MMLISNAICFYIYPNINHYYLFTIIYVTWIDLFLPVMCVCQLFYSNFESLQHFYAMVHYIATT